MRVLTTYTGFAEKAVVNRPARVLNKPLRLRVGELIEVKSKEEILETLDQEGCLDGLPFMPEMLQFCGKQFRVFRRAIKLCDTITKTGIRRMENAVLLENVRCDGSAHGECQAACLILWKENWLKRFSDVSSTDPMVTDGNGREATVEYEFSIHREGPIDDLYRATHGSSSGDSEVPIFRCQVTELKHATLPLYPWDIRYYVHEVISGNRGWCECLRGMLIMLFNAVQAMRGGCRFPYLGQGTLRKTPAECLNLQPGELVEVKSKEEILSTLDTSNKNRGLWFDTEQLKFCGKRYRVVSRVNQFINEKTGQMLKLPNDCIILEGVICSGGCHEFCHRSEYIYWREIWLKRVSERADVALEESSSK